MPEGRPGDYQQPGNPASGLKPEAAPESISPDGGAGDLKGTIVGVNSGLMKFKEAIQGVQEIPQDLKGQLDNIIQQYQQFVQSLAQAGQQPAEAPPMEEAAPPPVKKPPMRGPMAMNSGPNAKPIVQ